MSRRHSWLLPGLGLATVALALPVPGPARGSVPFIFDDNRIYAPLGFVRPDGTVRQALAYVDIGTPQPVLTTSLASELGLGAGRPLIARIGALRIEAAASTVAVEREDLGRTGPAGRATVPVEAILSGSMMKDYVVTIDYAARTLTVSGSGTVRPPGIPVPCEVNPSTGLISVRGEVAGRSYDMAIDFGSAYTWFRADTVARWTSAHPEWLRGRGAVGESNMQSRKPEARAVMVRVPEIRLGDLRLEQVGALGIRPDLPPFPPAPGVARVTGDMFDWYSAKAPRPVIGWIGANVLKAYRLTIDYPHRTLWWGRQGDPDAHDLEQVGLTLESRDHAYVVSGIAERDGRPVVDGIQIGDQLVRIDGLEVDGLTRGAIFGALHGAPGAAKTLTVRRNKALVTVHTTVTAF